MSGWLARLRHLDPASRRETVEARLREALERGLEREPAVARALASAGADGATLAGYTFDDAPPERDELRIGFTYRLLSRAGAVDVRGAGIAVLDDAGSVAFDDVDADVIPAEAGDD